MSEVQQNQQERYQADDEIDLLELWNILWQGKWIIIAITVVFAIGSVIYALSLPDIYRTEVLLSPVDEGRSGGNAAMLGQLGGLASLAGIDIGGSSGTSQKVRAIATLQSRAFIAQFFENHDLVVPFMASRPAGSSGVVEIDPELYDESSQQWVREVDPPRQPRPSNLEIYEAFSEILTVNDNAQTGLVTVSLEWYDPAQIKEWLDLLISDLNTHMRRQDVAEARRAINYLEEQLGRTQLVEMRNVFYNLIEQQMQTIMLADAREGYVFQIIDPPVVAEDKSAPNRPLICIFITILGLILSIAFVLIKQYLYSNSTLTRTT